MSAGRLEFGDHGEREDDTGPVATVLDEWTDDREAGALGFRLVTTDQGDIWLDMRVQDEDGQWSEWAEEDLDGPGADVLARIPALLAQERREARLCQRRESRLEVAARSLIAILEAVFPEYRKDLDPANAVDRAWLELWEAAEEAGAASPAHAPLKLFAADSSSRRIEAVEPGTRGLDVVFGEEAVGLLPVGFEPGISISYEAAARLRDVLVEDLGESGWQPMETAPRDGTRILVDFGSHGVHAVSWEDDIWSVDDQKHGPFPLRGYIETDIKGWMPLPARREARS